MKRFTLLTLMLMACSPEPYDYELLDAETGTGIDGGAEELLCSEYGDTVTLDLDGGLCTDCLCGDGGALIECEQLYACASKGGLK